jgi:hypothetical protein
VVRLDEAPARSGTADPTPAELARASAAAALAERTQQTPPQLSSDAMKALVEHARHQAATRFVALPVFLTTSGVLAGTYLSKTASAPVATEWQQVPLLGMLIALTFLVTEFTHTLNQILIWKRIGHDAPAGWQGFDAHRFFEGWLWVPRIVQFLMYPAVLVWWLSRLMGPVWGGGAIVPLAVAAGYVAFAALGWAVAWKSDIVTQKNCSLRRLFNACWGTAVIAHLAGAAYLFVHLT